MACKSRTPANTFNFIRLRRVTNGLVGDLPVNDLCPIDLTQVAAEIIPWYWGTTTLTDVSGLDVTTGTQVQANATGEISVPWSGSGVRLWFWHANEVPEKTHWRDPAFAINSGTIGNSGDLFLAPSAKNAGVKPGKFYITELSTVGKLLNIS